MMITYMSGHKGAERKHFVLKKKFPLIFPFQSLVSYKYVGQRLRPPPPQPHFIHAALITENVVYP